MKLTKSKLKQIIKEELQLVMGGMDHEENFIKALEEGFGEGTPPQGEFYKKQEIVAEDSLGTGIADAAAKEQEGISDRAFMQEEDELEEKKLSEPEKKEKEKVVKGMKKNKSDFKKRYGRDAESVMYATATKIAKEKA